MFNKIRNPDFIDNNPHIHAIRQGLVLSIPLLIIGSFALVLKFLPIPAYQAFLANFANGFILEFLTWINRATFDILSICITISVSSSYSRGKTNNTGIVLGAIFASLSAYMIFIAAFTPDFNIKSFGAQGMFTAMFSSVVFSSVYCKLVLSERFSFQLYTVGADNDFNTVISVIIPMLVTICIAYLLNLLIYTIFGVVGLDALINKGVHRIFDITSNGTIKSMLYVFLSNVFWFLGVHGTNVLYNVYTTIYVEGGVDPGIMSKSVIDVFILMGGCGTTLSLLVAMLVFGEQKSTRSLAKMAALPMIFNINELMVFGLPIVFNKWFLIPFIMTPMACIATTYLAISAGLVPAPIYPVEWVMPIIINGYQSTGSIAGSLLQIFNIGMGAFIYRFFLMGYEAQSSRNIIRDLDKLNAVVKEAETIGDNPIFLEQKGAVGSIARMLAEDLRHVLKNESQGLTLFYQPQYNVENKCIGAEALLRWNHPRCGMIYPPLLIAIARETGQLGVLERAVFKMACTDIKDLQEHNICPPKISVNATGASLQDEFFVQFLGEKFIEHPALQNVLCIELTEQMSFMFSGTVEGRLKLMHEMGIRFAVDDFSMGHTSVKYLQSNLFDLVKLDGSLVKDMMTNNRSLEIVSSIVQMSRSMHFSVIAEYVETEEQRDKLAEYGCYLYQGWLYSKAIPFDELSGVLWQEKYGVK